MLSDLETDVPPVKLSCSLMMTAQLETSVLWSCCGIFEGTTNLLQSSQIAFFF